MNESEQKTLCDLTLNDLMAADHNVWLERKSHDFYLILENEEGEEFSEKNLHPYAVESLAIFCKRFLKTYEKQQDKI